MGVYYTVLSNFKKMFKYFHNKKVLKNPRTITPITGSQSLRRQPVLISTYIVQTEYVL